jgi:signal transduction histidine kinase
MPEGVIWLSPGPEGPRIEHMNRTAVEMLCVPDDPTALEFEILDPLTLEPIPLKDRASARALDGETVRGLEVAIRRPGGLRRALCSAAPIRDSKGRVVGAVTVFQDITERVRLERELAEANRRLQERVAAAEQQLGQAETLAAIGTFAAGIAHDLRNPLSVLGNSLYLLRRRLGEDPKAARSLELMEENLRKADRIINELLALARREPPQLQPIDTARLFRDVLAGTTLPHSVDLEATVAAGLAPIAGDPGQLGQVLANLIENAVQAMPEGGRLTLEARPAPDGVALVVSDTGAGIPPEALTRIFEPLYTTRPKGTGLGLAICQKIARMHGGTLSAESEPGRGATFTLFLPGVVT